MSFPNVYRLDQRDDTPECATSAREWAMLIITIISMNVSWWLCDVPLLWSHGFRRYFSSVTWQCFRMYTPSCAALYALFHARTPEEEPYIYYVGPFFDDPSPTGTRVPDSFVLGENVDRPVRRTRSLSRFQTFKALAIDSLTIIATGLTIHETISLPVGTPVSGIGMSTWMYPTLPVAVLGIWHLVCGTWMQWRRTYTLWLGMLVVIAIGAAIITPVILLAPAAKENKLWIPAIFAYLIMALPVLALIDGPGFIVAIGFGFIIRVGGIGIGSLSDTAYFPFCQLRNKAFGATYLAVGGLGAVLAILGWVKFVFTSGLPMNPRNMAAYKKSFGPNQPIA